ncbi:MAG TPA: DoxX family protein [Terracidiphilus sp.]|nr:DoxX family protein [Terracidiphilus sp.]
MANVENNTAAAPAVSKGAFWTGWVLTGLIVLFLLFDAFGKFAKPVQVTDAFAKLGIPVSQSVILGALVLLCAILYAIPRTAVLGAVLLTGFLGGAVAIQMRVGNPVFETIFPVLFAAIAWLGIYLRRPALRAVLPLC